MKRILFAFFALIVLCTSVHVNAAQDYSKITTKPQLIAALDSLESINRRDVIAILNGRNATRRPIRVMFRDLRVLGYDDCEAVTMRTREGGLIIYINAQHKGASPECIACLLAHESQHHTFTNTKAEELRAWISEAQAWNEFSKRNKELQNSNEPLAKRENYIARIKTSGGVMGIQKLIASNPVYSGLN